MLSIYHFPKVDSTSTSDNDYIERQLNEMAIAGKMPAI